MNLRHLWEWLTGKPGQSGKKSVDNRAKDRKKKGRAAPSRGIESILAEHIDPVRGTPRRTGERRGYVINVGIDLGTSATKVVCRDLVQRSCTLYCPEVRPEGYPDFSVPSSVCLTDSCFFFGAAAEERSGKGRMFRSFKVCLACRYGAIPCRGWCDPVARAKGLPAGVFIARGDGSRSLQIPAEAIGALFLGWLIGDVCEFLSRQLPSESVVKTSFNMCVPMDQYDHRARKEFERVLYVAYTLAPNIRQGIPVAEALQYWKKATTANVKLPPESARPTFVVPETLAAIVGYVNAREAEEGLHSIVDVGAGTTDISFFRFTRWPSRAKPTAAFYYAHTVPIGGDEVDHELWLRATGGKSEGRAARHEIAAALQGVRLAKHMLETHRTMTFSVGSITLTIGREQFEEVAAQFSTRVVRAWMDAWREAFRKEGATDRWRDQTLFYAGGGSRLISVPQGLAQAQPRFDVPAPKAKPLFLGEAIALGKKTNSKDARHMSDLLAIAYGLSFPLVDYPDFFRPSEVEIFTPDLIFLVVRAESGIRRIL